MNFDISALARLDQWLLRSAAADPSGDWQHSYGVHIETTDNPGWWVIVELDETPLADRLIKATFGNPEWEVSLETGPRPKGASARAAYVGDRLLYGYATAGSLPILISVVVDFLEGVYPGTGIATGEGMNAFSRMLSETLPPATDLRSPSIVRLLTNVPAPLWNGYSLAATEEGKAASLELIRVWIDGNKNSVASPTSGE